MEGAEKAVRSLQEMQQVFARALFVRVLRIENRLAVLENYNLLPENLQVVFQKVYSIPVLENDEYL